MVQKPVKLVHGIPKKSVTTLTIKPIRQFTELFTSNNELRIRKGKRYGTDKRNTRLILGDID